MQQHIRFQTKSLQFGKYKTLIYIAVELYLLVSENHTQDFKINDIIKVENSTLYNTIRIQNNQQTTEKNNLIGQWSLQVSERF